MRIVNLNSRRLRLAKLGNVRKGIQVPVLDKRTKKPVMDKYGKIKTYPKEVPYFVVNIDDAFPNVQERFMDVYGKEPTTIRGFLASSNLDHVWMSAYEAYNWGGMIANSNGEIVTYLFDTVSKTKIITDGKLVAHPDPQAPFYNSVKDLKMGDSLPYENGMLVSNSGGGSKLELKARLNIIIQELNERAFFTVHTGGFGDVYHLQETVDDIFDIANRTNLSPIMIPIVLTRYEVERKYLDEKGNTKKRQGWDIQMRISPKVFEGVLEAYAESPIRLMATQPPALLPAGDGNGYIEQEHPAYLVEAPTELVEEDGSIYLAEEDCAEEKNVEQHIESGEPDITPMMVINEGFVDNAPHAKALLSLLEIPHQGYPASAGMERIQLYYKWRKMYSGKNADDRQGAAKHAIKGEEPEKLL